MAAAASPRRPTSPGGGEVRVLRARILASLKRDEEAGQEFEFALQRFGSFDIAVEYAVWGIERGRRHGGPAVGPDRRTDAPLESRDAVPLRAPDAAPRGRRRGTREGLSLQRRPARQGPITIGARPGALDPCPVPGRTGSPARR